MTSEELPEVDIVDAVVVMVAVVVRLVSQGVPMVHNFGYSVCPLLWNVFCINKIAREQLFLDEFWQKKSCTHMESYCSGFQRVYTVH